MLWHARWTHLDGKMPLRGMSSRSSRGFVLMDFLVSIAWIRSDLSKKPVKKQQCEPRIMLSIWARFNGTRLQKTVTSFPLVVNPTMPHSGSGMDLGWGEGHG